MPSSNTTEASDLHFEKTRLPSFVTEAGILMLSIEELTNAPKPISSNSSGRVTAFNPEY